MRLFLVSEKHKYISWSDLFASFNHFDFFLFAHFNITLSFHTKTTMPRLSSSQPLLDASNIDLLRQKMAEDVRSERFHHPHIF